MTTKKESSIGDAWAKQVNKALGVNPVKPDATTAQENVPPTLGEVLQRQTQKHIDNAKKKSVKP